MLVALVAFPAAFVSIPLLIAVFTRLFDNPWR